MHVFSRGVCGHTIIYQSREKNKLQISLICVDSNPSISHSASQQVCLEKILLGT